MERLMLLWSSFPYLQFPFRMQHKKDSIIVWLIWHLSGVITDERGVAAIEDFIVG